MALKERRRVNEVTPRRPSPAAAGLGSHAPSPGQTRPDALVRHAEADPRSLTRGEAIQLQRAIGNRAVGRVLARAARTQGPSSPKTATAAPLLKTPGAVVQRLAIPRAQIKGLDVDLDTASEGAFRQAVLRIRAEGKLSTLRRISDFIGSQKLEAVTQNDLTLRGWVDAQIREYNKKFDAIKESMGFLERWGTAVTPKQTLSELQSSAVTKGITAWVTGNPDLKINWSTINKHLRGVIAADEWGALKVLVRSKEKLADDVADDVVEARLQAVLTGLVQSISSALNLLPDYDLNDTKSYRVFLAENADVYKTRIRPGDYIMDRGFVATSIQRGGEGAASGWGQEIAEGQTKMKVYFQIRGRTGKDISPYSGIAGEKEVLYKPDTIFRVDEVRIEKKRAFVLVEEVAAPPAQGTPIKNPYNGNNY